MKKKKIIAVVGLPGSGKSEVVSYLMEKYGWPKVYFGEVTFDEIERLKLPITEENERKVRESLRKQFGVRAYSSRVVEKIKAIETKVVLAESLYSWDEYLHFKEEFGDDFVTLAVYAPPAQRYSRLSDRKVRKLTATEAQERDYSQIANLGQAGPISMADRTIVNDGTLEDLYEKVDELLL